MVLKIKPMTAGWIIAVIYLAGMIGLLFPLTSGLIIKMICPVLLFTFILLLCFHKNWTKEFVLAVFLVACICFLLDVLGVKTGYIFGYFQFGSVLGPKFWEVPLIMMAYWFTTIYITRQVAEILAKDILLVSVIAALLILILDYFLEPFALKFGFWSWNGGTVPTQNYIGRFLSGLIIQYIYIKSIKISTNKLAPAVYVVQLGFFIFFMLKM